MQDRGYAVTATAAVFLVLTWLAMVSRGWVRVKITKKLWFDDWMLIASMVLFNTFVDLHLTSVYFGTGKHKDDPGIRNLKVALQAWFYSDIFYILCATTLRVAAGEHLMRHVARNWQRWVVYVLTWLNILYNLAITFVIIFRCQPISLFWDRVDFSNDAVGGSCRLTVARRTMYVQAGLGAVVDFTFATLPLLFIRDQRLGQCQKHAVWAVVVVAELSGVASVMRIPAIREMRLTRDWTWAGVNTSIWSIAGLGIGILALCLATFAPIMTYLWPTAGRRRGYGNNVFRRDYDSEAALRGIPLGSGYGNITYVEGGSGRGQQRGKRKSPKGKMKDLQSIDTLDGEVEKWDIGIIKTTDIITVLDDGVSTVAKPQSVLTR